MAFYSILLILSKKNIKILLLLLTMSKMFASLNKNIHYSLTPFVILSPFFLLSFSFRSPYCHFFSFRSPFVLLFVSFRSPFVLLWSPSHILFSFRYPFFLSHNKKKYFFLIFY